MIQYHQPLNSSFMSILRIRARQIAPSTEYGTFDDLERSLRKVPNPEKEMLNLYNEIVKVTISQHRQEFVECVAPLLTRYLAATQEIRGNFRIIDAVLDDVTIARPNIEDPPSVFISTWISKHLHALIQYIHDIF